LCALAFSQSDEAYVPRHYGVRSLTASPHSIH
jgi:hypothetical protein